MKKLILSKYNQLSILLFLTIISGFLLMTRIKLSDSFYLIFLVWNVFLAAIPYGITFIVRLKPNWFKQAWLRIITFSVWILFLPNAPYILSDFIHLRWTSLEFLPLDTAIITGFSLLGLLYMYYSIRDMQQLYFSSLSKKQNLLFHLCICMLLGFGIYLGRYLRWNTWDLIQQPERLADDIRNLIIHPIQYKFAWLVTFSYAIISWGTIQIINKLKWVH